MRYPCLKIMSVFHITLNNVIKFSTNLQDVGNTKLFPRHSRFDASETTFFHLRYSRHRPVRAFSLFVSRWILTSGLHSSCRCSPAAHCERGEEGIFSLPRAADVVPLIPEEFNFDGSSQMVCTFSLSRGCRGKDVKTSLKLRYV